MDMNSKVLAKVDSVVITEADVDATIVALGQRGEAYNNPQGRKAVLEQLINKNLMLCEAKKNLYEYDPKFKAELAKIKDEMLANFAIEKAISSIKVSEDEAKKFYEDHKSELVGGETVDASHILVDSEDKANEILASINDGKITFEDAAKEYSSCPSKEKGGNLGEFGRGQMVPEFDTAVFDMEVGEVKGPVQTQFGYHLIKLNKKNEAKEIPYEDIKPQLMQKVLSDKQQAAYASKLNQLKILFPVDIF